jgi:predicted transcriptional regulator
MPLLAPNPPSHHLSSMADHPNIKADARELVEALPDTATWDDLAYEVYVRQAVATGLADADAGRTVSHDDAMARVRSRIRRAS